MNYLCAMKILMVCLGNICRSPLAEGVLRYKLEVTGLDWTVDSAGTGGWHAGEAPHHGSQKIAKLNGIDISGQRARQYKAADMVDFDIIYFMDSQNKIDAKRMSHDLWNDAKAELFLNELYPGRNKGVPDPWYGTEKTFHEVYEMIDKTCDIIIKKYSNK
mgnify:CR=1 FL=1